MLRCVLFSSATNRCQPIYLVITATQQQQWVEQISSGSQCINDVLMFMAVSELPFGGVGPSGMGQYSGKAGFEQFSHLKSRIKTSTLA